MADKSVTVDNTENVEKKTEETRSAPSQDQRRSRPRYQRTSSTSNYRKPVQFRHRRKVCSFCVDKIKTIGWKDVDSFRRYVTENGSIRARRKTGTCAKHQRRLAVAIKRARHMALLPFTGEHVRVTGKS